LPPCLCFWEAHNLFEVRSMENIKRAERLSTVVRKRVLTFLAGHPDFEIDIRRIMVAEVAFRHGGPEGINGDRNPRSDEGRGTAPGTRELGIAQRRLTKLHEAGILDCVYSSNKHKGYWTMDLDGVVEGLEAWEQGAVDEDGGLAEVPDDLFAPIIGHEVLCQELLKSLRAEKAVCDMIEGDEATGKTAIAMCIEQLRGALMRTGPQLSRAGVAKAIITTPGLRYLIIDEFEKAPGEVRDGLLGLDSGRFDKMVDGVDYAQAREVSIIALVNDTRKLTGPQLSRFTRYQVRRYTPEEARRVIAGVLKKWEGADPEHAEFIARTLVKKGFTDPRRGRDVFRKNPRDRQGAIDTISAMTALKPQGY